MKELLRGIVSQGSDVAMALRSVCFLTCADSHVKPEAQIKHFLQDLKATEGEEGQLFKLIHSVVHGIADVCLTVEEALALPVFADMSEDHCDTYNKKTFINAWLESLERAPLPAPEPAPAPFAPFSTNSIIIKAESLLTRQQEGMRIQEAEYEKGHAPAKKTQLDYESIPRRKKRSRKTLQTNSERIELNLDEYEPPAKRVQGLAPSSAAGLSSETLVARHANFGCDRSTNGQLPSEPAEANPAVPSSFESLLALIGFDSCFFSKIKSMIAAKDQAHLLASSLGMEQYEQIVGHFFPKFREDGRKKESVQSLFDHRSTLWELVLDRIHEDPARRISANSLSYKIDGKKKQELQILCKFVNEPQFYEKLQLPQKTE